MEETIKMLPRYRVPAVTKRKKTGGKRKKTHEEYVDELKIKNPTVVPMEEYVDSKTKIKHKCLLHDVIWEITPDGALNGKGCKECKIEKYIHKQTKTNDEYINELRMKNQNVVSIEAYAGVTTKIKHKCLIHNVIWEVAPTYVLQGKGCELCSSEKLASVNIKTNDEYLDELKGKNPNIIPLEKYIDAKTKIKHKCLIHNIIWKVQPNSILRGSGCKQCGIEKCSKSRIKTHNEYVEELKIKNQNMIPLEEYIGARTKILHLYLKCGHQAKVSPTNALKGIGCKVCSSEDKKITMDIYLSRLETKKINVEPLESLIDYKTPILHKYKDCGHEYKKSPRDVLSGNGCLICRPIKLHDINKMTQEEYISKLSNINDNIEVIGEYVNNHTSILHRFKRCGHVLNSIPANLLSGADCSMCNKSRLERYIENCLSKNNIEYIPQYKTDTLFGIGNGKLSFDFYLPKYNLLIEAQGAQHEEPVRFGGIAEEQAFFNFKKQQEHDKRKREYAKNHNINLLEIWYYDIDNIETILTEYLNNLKLESVETAISA